MKKINIFWHRRDLRYTDNTGLWHALSEDLPVLPVFIFDVNILSDLKDRKDARVSFIHESVCKLDAAYRENGSGLLVLFATPEAAFRELVSRYDVQAVYTNRDYEPYASARDKAVENLLQGRGIPLYAFKDHVIFEAGEILNDRGAPYKVFTPYKNRWQREFEKSPLPAWPCEEILGRLYQSEVPPIPTLEHIGFRPSGVCFPPAAVSSVVLRSYGEKRDFPAEQGTTRIGVHLRFGTISIRQVVKVGAETSEAWLRELIWREFYMMILAHFPYVVNQSFKPKYDKIRWINDEEHFRRWCEGKTGYPLVDAGMRELNATGYMHNRVRMVVASFLTRHLLIDWRWGERYFAEKLLDYELASNNGGWQWAAGTGTDAQPYFRVFNPRLQQERFDKDQQYVQQWVPELGTEAYPKPIVDHKMAVARAIETYRELLS